VVGFRPRLGRRRGVICHTILSNAVAAVKGCAREAGREYPELHPAAVSGRFSPGSGK
jgi:hypothetical protein